MQQLQIYSDISCICYVNNESMVQVASKYLTKYGHYGAHNIAEIEISPPLEETLVNYYTVLTRMGQREEEEE